MSFATMQSKEKTSVYTGFRRPMDSDYSAQSTSSSGNVDKTGEGRIFKHKVGNIEVEITDDVGTRGFHLSEIDPTTVCMTGFRVKPDLTKMVEILQEAGELYRLKCVPTKSTNSFENLYIFAHFESNAYNDHTFAIVQELIPQFTQEYENILCINRSSRVEQIFFGSLMPHVTEQNLVQNIDFGDLIHIEIKRRGQKGTQGTNYGFATLLESQEHVKKLVTQRFHTVKGCKIEFKPKLKREKSIDTSIDTSTQRKVGKKVKEFKPKHESDRFDDEFNFRSPPAAAEAYDDYSGYMRTMRRQAYQQQMDAAYYRRWTNQNPSETKMWRKFVMRKMMRDEAQDPYSY